MLKKMIMVTLIAGISAMAISSAASAGSGKGFKRHGGHLSGKVSHKGFKLGHKRHFKGRRFKGRHFYFDYGWRHNYAHNCYWLKRKARITGKRYWWKRYYSCKNYSYSYYY